MTDSTRMILDLFNQGKKLKEIAIITGKKYKNLSRMRIKYADLCIPYINSIPIRGYVVNDTFFDNIDSEIKAYLLGYFIADGNIDKTKSRFSIGSSIDDEEVVNLFSQYISKTVPIKHRFRFRNEIACKEMLEFRWTSNHMKDLFINKYKILPRKTYDNNFTFPFELIPSEFHGHFIRGFFDGDGYVGIHEKAISLHIVLTSLPFLNQIINIINNNCIDFKPKIEKINGKTIDYYKLYLRSGSGKFGIARLFYTDVYNLLYKNSNFYLSRKLNKFKEYIH